jgi:hypothetical protein
LKTFVGNFPYRGFESHPHRNKVVRMSFEVNKKLNMKEIILGKDWEEKSFKEKAIKISKVVDMGTIFTALLIMGVAPGVATAAIEASVVTYAGAEIIDSGKKK